jgi:hypothetical protein
MVTRHPIWLWLLLVSCGLSSLAAFAPFPDALEKTLKAVALVPVLAYCGFYWGGELRQKRAKYLAARERHT